RPREAECACRNGRCALNGKFSCHAPLERRVKRRRNEPLPMECPGAGLRAGFRVGGPAPGKESTFPGKPRNPDESFQAHVTHLVEETCFLKVSRDRRHGPDQNIAKARIINPNMATATIAFVAVSIVASGWSN